MLFQKSTFDYEYRICLGVSCTYLSLLQVWLSKVKTYLAKTYFKNVLKDGFIDPNKYCCKYNHVVLSSFRQTNQLTLIIIRPGIIRPGILFYTWSWSLFTECYYMCRYKDQWDPGCTTTRHNIWPFEIRTFLLGFQMVFDKMAAVCLDFK